MWLSELKKGMTVRFTGRDGKDYTGTVEGWTARLVYVRVEFDQNGIRYNVQLTSPIDQTWPEDMYTKL